mmetsp:Transcript_27082/g.74337  ORF Transcript_27082/g.74337 Transcript_27082/m.74337 type:complete len:127 (-) Transcript_27082:465-845(-)
MSPSSLPVILSILASSASVIKASLTSPTTGMRLLTAVGINLVVLASLLISSSTLSRLPMALILQGLAAGVLSNFKAVPTLLLLYFLPTAQLKMPETSALFGINIAVTSMHLRIFHVPILGSYSIGI